jgi:hypothetical protein
METRGHTGTADEMRTLASCTNKMKRDGYKEDFQVTKKGLATFNEDKYYKPEQVHIVNFFRYEGTSDPGDNSILYVIETDDGVKGTLVDGYGATSDEEVAKFIAKVDDIQKKVPSSKIDA